MKITCVTQNLAEACINVQRAVSAKTTIPAVEGILLSAQGNEVQLTGYDLEMGIRTAIESRVQEEGAIVLNARLLCDILRKLPGENVTIESDSRNIAKIKSEEMDYSIVGIAAEEYPELPSVTGGYPVVVTQGMIKEMVRQTIFAVAAKENKVVHTGIKFEISEGELRLVAVDGVRLALRKEKIEYDGEEISFVVPAKTLSEVVKLMEDDDAFLSMGVGKRHIVFEVLGYSVVSRLLDGEFLNYRSSIPQNCITKVRVKTRQFIESIERTSLILTDKLKSPVKCEFEDNFIHISSVTSMGTAMDKIPAETQGEPLEIGVNNKFLIEALRVCDTDTVHIEMNGPISPILILPTEGDSFLFLVLPVRLRNE